MAETRYSLIIPVYRNEETLDALLAALQPHRRRARQQARGGLRSRRFARSQLPDPAAAPAVGRLPVAAHLAVAQLRFLRRDPHGARGGTRAVLRRARGRSAGAARADRLLLPRARIRTGRHHNRHAREPRRPADAVAVGQPVLEPVPALRAARSAGRRRRCVRLQPACPRRPAAAARIQQHADRPAVLARLPPQDHRLHPPAAGRRPQRLDLPPQVPLPDGQLLRADRPAGDADHDHRAGRLDRLDPAQHRGFRRLADRRHHRARLHAGHPGAAHLLHLDDAGPRHHGRLRLAHLREHQGPAALSADDPRRCSARTEP